MREVVHDLPPCLGIDVVQSVLQRRQPPSYSTDVANAKEGSPFAPFRYVLVLVSFCDVCGATLVLSP